MIDESYLVCTQCMTYNHASYISDALNGFSIQRTSFPVVYVIVDDASTDGTTSVIRAYLNEYFDLQDTAIAYETDTDYAHIIHARHKENTNCFFTVLFLKENHYSQKKKKDPYLRKWKENAKYLAFCEGDDYWTAPDKLQKQVDLLETNPEFSMCYATCRYYHQDTLKFDKSPWGGRATSLDALLKGNTVPTLTVVERMSVHEKYRLFKDNESAAKGWLMGDYPQWLFCATEGELVFMDYEVGVYRVLRDSASHSATMKRKLDFSMNMVDIMEYFDDSFAGGKGKRYYEKLRGVLRLRTYAIYGCLGKYVKEWGRMVSRDKSFLFEKNAYKYLAFFISPRLGSLRK